MAARRGAAGPGSRDRPIPGRPGSRDRRGPGGADIGPGSQQHTKRAPATAFRLRPILHSESWRPGPGASPSPAGRRSPRPLRRPPGGLAAEPARLLDPSRPLRGPGARRPPGTALVAESSVWGRLRAPDIDWMLGDDGHDLKHDRGAAGEAPPDPPPGSGSDRITRGTGWSGPARPALPAAGHRCAAGARARVRRGSPSPGTRGRFRAEVRIVELRVRRRSPREPAPPPPPARPSESAVRPSIRVERRRASERARGSERQIETERDRERQREGVGGEERARGEW